MTQVRITLPHNLTAWHLRVAFNCFGEGTKHKQIRKEELKMSEVTLTIMDAHRAIHGRTHGSIADKIVAALSAEPETIEELEAAVARFIKPTDEHGLFDFFSEGICEDAWDAGIVLVDLAARVAAGESTYSSFQKQGRVQYHDGSAATDVWVNYQVPDDWLFISHIDGWQALTQRRRDESVNLRRREKWH